MRCDPKVVEQLNAALSFELTAIVQYMTQSEMCQNWRYKRRGERTKARAIEELRHAEGLIERIIFLDNTPAVDVGLKPQLGSNVQQQMGSTLRTSTMRSTSTMQLQRSAWKPRTMALERYSSA
jgi:bacterioferritin